MFDLRILILYFLIVAKYYNDTKIIFWIKNCFFIRKLQIIFMINKIRIWSMIYWIE